MGATAIQPGSLWLTSRYAAAAASSFPICLFPNTHTKEQTPCPALNDSLAALLELVDEGMVGSAHALQEQVVPVQELAILLWQGRQADEGGGTKRGVRFTCFSFGCWHCDC